MYLKLPKRQLDFLANTRGDRSMQAYIVDIIEDYSRNISKQENYNGTEDQTIRYADGRDITTQRT